MSWYMRGGLSYEDAMMLSLTERELISKIIKDNMETTQKSRLPFF
jgi:phage-related holin